jgi:hypothetical protein
VRAQVDRDLTTVSGVDRLLGLIKNLGCHNTAQLGEAGTYNSLKVRLFSLSLTDTAFAWFSSLAPNSIDSWDQLEQKFHDHFFSGSYQLKLTDLTSVRQNKQESVSNYLKRFKEVKNFFLICLLPILTLLILLLEV